MSNILTENLKRLRCEKGLTQEQVAQRLGVSPQAVSRWECAITLPDVMLLPELARLYGVTVDDLYRRHPSAYENYAQRLTAIFSESRSPEDFATASAEFDKLRHAGQETANDLRMEGILNQYMAMRCILRAVAAFDEGIARARQSGDSVTLWKTRRQRAYFLARIGRGDETVREQLAAIESSASRPQEWTLLVAACLYRGDAQAAREWYQKAILRFPEEAILHVYGGDAYRALGQLTEAFACWDRALALDGTLRDAKFSKAEGYEELGDYGKARDLWREIIAELRQAGYESELAYPLAREEACSHQIKADA